MGNLAPRPEALISILAISLLVTFLLGFTAVFRMDEAAIGRGRFVAAGGNIPIHAPDGGLIESVIVREGQRVRTNDVLVIFESVGVSTADQSTSEEILRLQALIARIQALRDDKHSVPEPVAFQELNDPLMIKIAREALAEQRQVFSNERYALRSALEASDERSRRFQLQKEALAEQVRFGREQLDLLQDELAGLRLLQERGYAPLTKVRAAERAIAAQMASVAQILAQTSEVESQIAEVSHQRSAILLDHRKKIYEDLRLAETQLNRLKPEHQATRRSREDAILRAPVNGWVMELAAMGPGQVLPPGDRILTLVPEHAPLEIKATFSPNHSNELQVGQSANVRLRASGGNPGLVLSGKIIAISPDAVSLPSGEEVIIATIVLPTESMLRAENSRASGAVRAGTPVEVTANVRRRSLIEYLSEPLVAGASRAFREP